MDQAGAETRVGLKDAQTEPQRLLAEGRADVTRRAPQLEVREVVRVADPRDVLRELSQEAAMVVLGSRGRGPMRTLLLRSVGVAVTRHAECPVVVVRPGNRGLVRNGVLVGADGSERSQSTLEFAYRQASLCGLPLTVLHCHGSRGRPDGRRVDRTAAEEERLLLAESVAGMAEKFPDVRVRTEVARGLADACLVWMAERMDMVVVGSHHGGPGSETALRLRDNVRGGARHVRRGRRPDLPRAAEGRCSGHVAVDVDPPVGTPLEAAPLVQHAVAGRAVEVGAELHLAGVVVRTAVDRVEDLEPGPGQARASR